MTREKLIASAMDELRKFKKEHPFERAALKHVARELDKESRNVYVTAARRLGWNVVRSYGHVYENGLIIW